MLFKNWLSLMEDDNFNKLCRLGLREASKILRTDALLHESFITRILSIYLPCNTDESDAMDMESNPVVLEGEPIVTWLLWLSTSPQEDEVL